MIRPGRWEALDESGQLQQVRRFCDAAAGSPTLVAAGSPICHALSTWCPRHWRNGLTRNRTIVKFNSRYSSSLDLSEFESSQRFTTFNKRRQLANSTTLSAVTFVRPHKSLSHHSPLSTSCETIAPVTVNPSGKDALGTLQLDFPARQGHSATRRIHSAKAATTCPRQRKTRSSPIVGLLQSL